MARRVENRRSNNLEVDTNTAARRIEVLQSGHPSEANEKASSIESQ